MGAFISLEISQKCSLCVRTQIDFNIGTFLKALPFAGIKMPQKLKLFFVKFSDVARYRNSDHGKRRGPDVS